MSEEIEIYDEDLKKLERLSKSRNKKPEDILHELILKKIVKGV